MKSIFSSFLCWSFSITAVFAQEVTTEYFDRDGKPVAKEAAYFYRVAKKVPTIRQGDTIFMYVDTVKTFYASSNQLRSKTVFNSEGQSNGEYLRFYETGVVRERGSYSKGALKGIVTTYYLDGKVKMVRRYPEETEPATPSGPFSYRLLFLQ